jgi:Flp pilus assembly pilin Flp
VRSEKGQTFAEYAIVLAVLAIGVVVVLGTLTTGISGAVGKVTGLLPG